MSWYGKKYTAINTQTTLAVISLFCSAPRAAPLSRIVCGAGAFEEYCVTRRVDRRVANGILNGARKERS